MAIRIGEYIVGGFLNNTQPNCVHGWLAFNNDRGVRIDLLGNFAGDLEGKRFEFEVPDVTPASAEALEEMLKGVPIGQIGAAGDMLLRIVRIPAGPPQELMARIKLGEPPPIDECPCLYLEWYGQNGRVVAEIVNPVLSELFDADDETGEENSDDAADVTPTPLPTDDEAGLSITGFSIDDEGNETEFNLEESVDNDEDPYGLFPTDLEQQIQSNDADIFSDDSEAGESPQSRSWDEVIPGIDPKTKALYEQWDEIYGGTKDELLSQMLDPPLQLPPSETIDNEETARGYVLQIAASLARLGVAIDLCPHFTMVQTYHWLINEILTEGHAHPGLTGTDIVMHYSTYESCAACDAEFEARSQREQRDE